MPRPASCACSSIRSIRFRIQSPTAGVAERGNRSCRPRTPPPSFLPPWAAPTKSGLDFYYNGKIDSPRLASRASERGRMRGTRRSSTPKRLAIDIVGDWDFSAKMDSQTAVDLSPNRLHGNVVNFPARAMTGWNWTGELMNYNEDPQQWGAIHFHDDDVYDAGWEPDFTLTVPPDIKSGIYAARLRSGGDEEYIPFTVGPEPGKEKQDRSPAADRELHGLRQRSSRHGRRRRGALEQHPQRDHAARAVPERSRRIRRLALRRAFGRQRHLLFLAPTPPGQYEAEAARHARRLRAIETVAVCSRHAHHRLARGARATPTMC